MMNQFYRDIVAARQLIERGNWIEAANSLIKLTGQDTRAASVDEAKLGIIALYHALVNAGDFTGAALLRWGQTLFNPEPRSVKIIWKYLNDPLENKILIYGCGSSGKTYSTSAWVNMNWDRDPQYTCGKIVSTTAGHAKSGIMSRISSFHRNSIIPFTGEQVAGGLMYPGDDKSASVLAVAIPEGDTGEGRLTGAHPYPRMQAHPLFGDMSRCFIVIDEADQVAEGAWNGIDNNLGNEDFEGSIKVVALTNPRNKNNPFAFRAEPEEGWSWVTEDVDTWISREGWRVIKIDAAKSENVVNKKKVFNGLMTYQGYMNYVRKGKQDPAYWIYARGMYPPDSVGSFNVFSMSSFEGKIGRLMFEGRVTPCAGIDPAFADGGDDAMLDIGRFGMAMGVTNEQGQWTKFERPRKALQVEAQIPLVKGKTEVMGAGIIKILRAYGVRPEWVTMDKTGNSRGLYDYLCWQFGKVEGIEWGGKSTETKILYEDTETADKRYKGIAAEMWFATSEWLEHGFVYFSPQIEGFHKIRDECCMRLWHFHQTLQMLETKAEFKKGNKGKSCDRADAFVMLPHSIRIRSQGLPMVQGDRAGLVVPSSVKDDQSPVDAGIKWIPDWKIGA